MRPRRSTINQAVLIALLVLLGVFTLFPFAMTLLISQKSNAELLTRFFAWPEQFRPEYYTDAYAFVVRYIVNSLVNGVAVVAGVVFLSSISGYAFARINFRGRKQAFLLIIALLMVPGILTLVPAYKWYNMLPFVGGNNWLGYGGDGLLNKRLVLIIPYIAGGQIFGIFLCRTFFEQLPNELFEAARIDGATEFGAYRYLALPLSVPILATLAIMTAVGQYNDYIWPSVAMSDNKLQVFAVGVTLFGVEGNLDQGPQMAGFVIGSIPLVLIFAFGMKYYIEGLTKGGLKA